MFVNNQDMDKTFFSNLEDNEVLFPPIKNVEGVKSESDFSGRIEQILLEDALKCEFDSLEVEKNFVVCSQVKDD